MARILRRPGRTPPRVGVPQAFGVSFLGNGINEDHWGAEGSGAEMKLSKTLAPLEPLKQKINVIHGLYNKTSDRAGHSSRRRPAACSGRADHKGAVIQSGISVDQMIANRSARTRRSRASCWPASSR